MGKSRKSLIIELMSSIIGLVIVLLVMYTPISILAPLGNMLNPGMGIGVWGSAPPPGIGCSNSTVILNSSKAQVIVCITSDGFIRIASNEDWALFYEQGYLTAEYRLAQLMFMRAMAEGNLSSIVGPSMIQSDEFYRTLETTITAQETLNQLNKSSAVYRDLYYYTLGVNSYIKSMPASRVPIVFKVLGYAPTPWSIRDTFAVQQLLTWSLSGTDDPLAFTFALESMPRQAIESLYPAYPPSIQFPIYPRTLNPSIYIGPGNLANLSLYSMNPLPPGVSLPLLNKAIEEAIAFFQGSDPAYSDSIVSKVLQGFNPFSHVVIGLTDAGSNNWVANSTQGGALLANDPHLTTTVPSIWLGFQLVAPGINVVGVDFPGTPGVILGHNPYIAWGATDAEPQVCYFYVEETSPQHPGEYFHNGSWIPFTVIHEVINVKGSGEIRYTVERAANGVVVSNYSNVVIVMDWTGLYPNDEVAAFLGFDTAKNLTEFLSSLSNFAVGIQNFAYADDKGNFGIFAYGLYPVIAMGNPRAVLPGYGNYDWIGFIPRSKQPFVLNPYTGFAASANQVPVSPGYPYYVGWSYESGFRADEINTDLSRFREEGNLSTSSMEATQLDIHDYSTNIFLPPLLSALIHGNTSPVGREAIKLLSEWNGDFSINSSAATIYYYWLNYYLNDTFLPWLTYYNITPAEGLGQFSFFLGPDSDYHGQLILDLANWTVNYPDSPWFNDPLTGEARNADYVMLLAFNQTMNYLSKLLGPNPSTWMWGRLHKRLLASFFGLSGLSIGPFPSPGDGNTINAAYGLTATLGPSWRLVVDMANPLNAVGVYPGGISEHPLMPLYNDTTAYWLLGKYYTLIPTGLPEAFYYLYIPGVKP